MSKAFYTEQASDGKDGNMHTINAAFADLRVRNDELAKELAKLRGLTADAGMTPTSDAGSLSPSRKFTSAARTGAFLPASAPAVARTSTGASVPVPVPVPVSVSAPEPPLVATVEPGVPGLSRAAQAAALTSTTDRSSASFSTSLLSGSRLGPSPPMHMGYTTDAASPRHTNSLSNGQPAPPASPLRRLPSDAAAHTVHVAQPGHADEVTLQRLDDQWRARLNQWQAKVKDVTAERDEAETLMMQVVRWWCDFFGGA